MSTRTSAQSSLLGEGAEPFFFIFFIAIMSTEYTFSHAAAWKDPSDKNECSVENQRSETALKQLFRPPFWQALDHLYITVAKERFQLELA